MISQPHDTARSTIPQFSQIAQHRAIALAANALFLPTRSCMHVNFTRAEYYPEAVSVKISPDQYRKLTAFIRKTFRQGEDGRFIHITNHAYFQSDAFFDSHGEYHLFNTCNSWAGRALRTAGVRVPWQSTLPKTPMMYLPKRTHP